MSLDQNLSMNMCVVIYAYNIYYFIYTSIYGYISPYLDIVQVRNSLGFVQFLCSFCALHIWSVLEGNAQWEQASWRC